MTGRYIPPARRNRADSAIKQTSEVLTDSPAQYTTHDIQAHYWKGHADALADRATLNSSADNPSSLAYIILFHGANPRWQSDRIIFVKSNLRLLPLETESGQAESSQNQLSQGQPLSSEAPQDSSEKGDGSQPLANPVAVFEQEFCGRPRHAKFHFAGYFNIKHLEYLEPKSEGLVRMLQQKWEAPVDSRARSKKPHERDRASWEESLSRRWAVVKLVRDEATEQAKGPPRIEVLNQGEESPQREQKSVNELLRELRMGDGEKKKEENNT